MILECLFIGFLFSLVKKLYEQYINQSKTAKVVLLFQFILSFFLTYLIGFNFKLISILVLLIFLTHIFIVDVKEYLIPYSSIISILIIGIFGFITQFFGFNDLFYSFDSIKNKILGFIIFVIIWIILTIIQKRLKKDFLGGGDLMLFCVFSLIVGLKNTLFIIFMSSFIAILSYPFIKNKKQLPFGPYLVISFLIIIVIYL